MMKDKQYYINLYDKEVEKVLKNHGDVDTNEYIDFNVDLIIGYYLSWYEEEAFKTWLENIKDLESIGEKEKKVTEILKELSRA